MLARAALATFPGPTISWSNWSSDLADLHGKEAALVFTSGYLSNETGGATVAKLLPNTVIHAWTSLPSARISGDVVINRSGGFKIGDT